MENALISLILIGLILFSVLSITQVSITSEDALLTSWRDMEALSEERARTDPEWVSASTSPSGSSINVVLHNGGATRLADFDEWDVVVQYYTTSNTYYIRYITYTDSTPGSNEWTVSGIYSDYSSATPEYYEPDVLNPGEDVVLNLSLSPPTDPAGTKMVIIAVANGVTVEGVFSN